MRNMQHASGSPLSCPSRTWLNAWLTGGGLFNGLHPILQTEALSFACWIPAGLQKLRLGMTWTLPWAADMSYARSKWRRLGCRPDPRKTESLQKERFTLSQQKSLHRSLHRIQYLVSLKLASAARAPCRCRPPSRRRSHQVKAGHLLLALEKLQAFSGVQGQLKIRNTCCGRPMESLSRAVATDVFWHLHDIAFGPRLDSFFTGLRPVPAYERKESF